MASDTPEQPVARSANLVGAALTHHATCSTFKLPAGSRFRTLFAELSVSSYRARSARSEAVGHDQVPPRREFPVLRAEVVDGLAAVGPAPATLDQVRRSGLVKRPTSTVQPIA